MTGQEASLQRRLPSVGGVGVGTPPPGKVHAKGEYSASLNPPELLLAGDKGRVGRCFWQRQGNERGGRRPAS